MEGFIKIHRQMVEWEWYTDGNTFRLFFHLLLKANHKDGNWRGQEVKRGQLITGRFKLAEELCLSEQQIRTSLNKLKSTNEITIKSTKKNSLIEVTNYNKYQDSNQQSNQQVTKKQPTSNHKQEGKEGKNDNNNILNSEVATKVAHSLKDLMLLEIDKQKIITDYNSTDEFIKKEMYDFYLYWSEKKPNGKKELWQMQKTFDINRRFNKWLQNSSKWNKKEDKKNKGAFI